MHSAHVEADRKPRGKQLNSRRTRLRVCPNVWTSLYSSGMFTSSYGSWLSMRLLVKMYRPLICRNLASLPDDADTFVRSDGLGCRIAIGNYKMFPVAGRSLSFT